ncbi:hypothetical protein B0H13DRAFT_360447 [Mycena leptocephala]|nr:hypothetical protein B0H13DRAFT_360447 [Mycena leptocephala]
MGGSRVSTPLARVWEFMNPPSERARRQRGDGTAGGTAVKVICSHDDERGLAAFMRVRVHDLTLVRPGRTRQPRGWGWLIRVVPWSTRTGVRNGTIARMEGWWNWMGRVRMSIRPHVRARVSTAGSTAKWRRAPAAGVVRHLGRDADSYEKAAG